MSLKNGSNVNGQRSRNYDKQSCPKTSRDLAQLQPVQRAGAIWSGRSYLLFDIRRTLQCSIAHCVHQSPIHIAQLSRVYASIRGVIVEQS